MTQAPEPTEVNELVKRSVLRSIIAATTIIALFAVAGGLLLNAGGNTSQHAIHAQLEFFSVFTLLSIFLLASAKYVVSRETAYRYIGIGALAASLFDLVHPALDSALVEGSVGPMAGAWLGLAGRLLFAVGFAFAARAFVQNRDDLHPTRALVGQSLSVVVLVLVTVLVAAVAPLPDYYAFNLGSGPLAELLPLSALLVAGYYLLVMRRPDAEGVRTVGVSAIIVALVAQAFSYGSLEPYDTPFFAAHVTKVVGILVLLFGLYLEHVRLYTQERTLRETLQSAHGELFFARLELDAIIDNLTIGVALTDAEGRLVRLNRAAEAILGRRVPGVLPQDYSSTYNVKTIDGRPFPADQFPVVRALATHAPVTDVEMLVGRPDGLQRRINVGAVPLLDARGSVRGAVAAFNDVTEIRAVEQRFRDLTDSAPDAVIVADSLWRVTLFNRAAERLFGYERREVVGRDAEELIPLRLREEYTRARSETTKPGAAGQRPYQARGRRKDGTEVPVEVTISESPSSAGSLYIAHVRDVSQRERVRREREGITSVALSATSTHTTEEFLERAATAIVSATDFDACAVYTSDPERRNLILSAHQGLPDEVVQRIKKYPLDPAFTAIAVQTWFGQGVIVERQLQDRAGLQVPPELMTKYRFKSLISARLGTQEDPWGVLQVVASGGRHPPEEDVQLIELLAQEITTGLRQKRLIQQLEQSTEELRAANRELDSFIYTASHDLAEPLRSISNFSHFLIEDYGPKLDEQARDYLERVNGGTIRMKRLLDDLLRLSRHGRSRAPRVRVDPSEVLAEARESLDAAIRDKKAVMDVPESMPAVVADRTGLLEVFTNLISNGLKFNENPTPRITVTARLIPGFVEFVVRDNGIGILAEHFDRIFGLFTRLHTRKAYPGTGAGLAIVKKIVENHGGRIWLESVHGDGSAFHFTMPAAAARAKRLEVAQPRPPVS